MIINEFELSYAMIVREGLQHLLELKDATGEKMRYVLKGGPEVSVAFQYTEKDWCARLRWKLNKHIWASAIWVRESNVEPFLNTLRDLLLRLKSEDLTLPEPGNTWIYRDGQLVSNSKKPRVNVDIDLPSATQASEAMADLQQAMQYLARQFEGQPHTRQNIAELSRRMDEITDQMARLNGDSLVTTRATVTRTDGTSVRYGWSSGTDGGEF